MDGFADVFGLDGLRALQNARVEAGVPGGKNAWLLYLHANGSPGRGIPPRPVLEPALNDPSVQEVVAELFAQAALSALEGEVPAAMDALGGAGQLLEDAVKAYFDTGNLAPNAPATIRAKNGGAPLIDTGGLRESITHRVERG